MCFPKAPKQAKPVNTGQDQQLAREQAQAEQDNAALKADNKQARMEQQLAILQGRVGRKSLFSGGQGGAGFPLMARQFSGSPGSGPGPSPTPSPTGPTGGTGSTSRVSFSRLGARQSSLLN